MSITERSELETAFRRAVDRIDLPDGTMKARVLDRFWLHVEPDDSAMKPWFLLVALMVKSVQDEGKEDVVVVNQAVSDRVDAEALSLPPEHTRTRWRSLD